jgi:outer membrane protein TolC
MMKIIKKSKIGSLMILCIFFFGAIGLQASETNEGISLATAIQMAVENPNNLGPSSEAVVVAQAQVGQAEAARWPAVGLSGQYTKSGPYTTINPNTFMPEEAGVTDTYSTGFNLQLPLYMGGKINSSIVLARLGLNNAEEEKKAEYDNLVYQVIQSYIGFLKADGMLGLSKEQIKLLAEHQRLVETNLDLGYAAKTDLLETQIRLTQAELGSVKAEHGKKLAGENLSNLLDITPEKLILTSKPVIPKNFTLPGLEEVLGMAEVQRPELNNIRLAVKIAEERLKMVGGYWKPNLALVGTYGTQNKDRFTLEDAIWSFTLNLDWKLFDGGKGRAEVKEAEANLRKLNYLLEQSKNMINLEVRQKYLTATEAARVLELTKLSRQQTEENYEFLKTKYQLGAATNLELLSAHNSLNSALNELLNAEYDYYLAILSLYKAMGETEKFILEVSKDA